MARAPFTRPQGWIVGTAALLVLSRVFGMSVVLPDFRAHADTLTTSPLLAGVALGAYALTLALMQLPMGMLSDRWGRRPVLLIGTLLFVAGSAWAALADSIGTLIAARLVQGMGAVSSSAMAMVGESVPDDRRTMAMAMVGIPAGGGFMLGLIAGPLLSPALGVPGLFWLTAASGLVAALPLLWVHPGNATQDLGHVGRVGRPAVGLAVAGFTANFALLSVMFHLADAGTGALVPLLVVALVVMVAASGLADRRGWTWQPAAVGLPLLAAGAAAYILADAALAVLGGLVFFAAHATLAAVLPSQVSRVAGRTGGRGHGIQNLVAYPGSFLGAAAAGQFQAAGVPGAVFVVLALLAVAAALGVTWTLRTGAAGNPVPQSS